MVFLHADIFDFNFFGMSEIKWKRPNEIRVAKVARNYLMTKSALAEDCFSVFASSADK